MTPELTVTVLTCVVTVLAGLLGTATIIIVGRRTPRIAGVLAPVVIVASVGLAIVVAARAMFLNPHDFGVLLVILAASLPTAVATGAWTGNVVTRLQRREAEAALERERRAVMRDLSHDLRTPLAGIVAMTESLQDGLAQHPDRYLTQIHEQANRMGDMISDLLATSTPDRHTLTVVDLNETVEASLSALTPVADRSRVTLHCRLEADPLLAADPDLLRRAVDNLLSNAVRHTPGGGRVKVTASSGSAATIVEVIDGCGGLADSTLATIVTGTGTSSVTSPRPVNGYGLGVVTRAAHLHGGSVEVANVVGGCRFRLLLPRTA